MKNIILTLILLTACTYIFAQSPVSKDTRDYVKSLKIGTFSNSFKCDFRTAMEKSHALGMKCTELYNNTDIDVFSPFSNEKVAEIKKICKDNNIKISSLCAEVGGFNIEDTKEVLKRVESVKTAVDNAEKLGVKMIQFHFGAVAFAEDDPRYVGNKSTVAGEKGDPTENLINSVKEIDAYCQKKHIIIAQETGPQTGADLVKFIKANNLKNTKINFDPANLVMYNFDEIRSLFEAKDYVVQIHVKDGIRDTVKTGYIEKPLGQGDVKWEEFFQGLKKNKFRGDLIIEKEFIEDPDADMAYAFNFLAG